MKMVCDTTRPRRSNKRQTALFHLMTKAQFNLRNLDKMNPTISRAGDFLVGAPEKEQYICSPFGYSF